MATLQAAGSPARPRRRPTEEARRKTILDCAAALFDERGYSGTTTQDIADAAQITKRTLYRYMPSKEDILFEIHSRFIDDRVVTDGELTGDEVERVDALLREHIRVAIRHREEIRVFFDEMKHLSDAKGARDLGEARRLRAALRQRAPRGRGRRPARRHRRAADRPAAARRPDRGVPVVPAGRRAVGGRGHRRPRPGSPCTASRRAATQLDPGAHRVPQGPDARGHPRPAARADLDHRHRAAQQARATSAPRPRSWPRSPASPRAPCSTALATRKPRSTWCTAPRPTRRSAS